MEQTLSCLEQLLMFWSMRGYRVLVRAGGARDSELPQRAVDLRRLRLAAMTGSDPDLSTDARK